MDTMKRHRTFAVEYRLAMEENTAICEETGEMICDFICEDKSPEQYICFGLPECRRCQSN